MMNGSNCEISRAMMLPLDFQELPIMVLRQLPCDPIFKCGQVSILKALSLFRCLLQHNGMGMVSRRESIKLASTREGVEEELSKFFPTIGIITWDVSPRG